MRPSSQARSPRILKISRVVSDIGRSATFYERVLSFKTGSRTQIDPKILEALGIADNSAEEMPMRLGTEEIVLVQFATKGQPYPAESRGNDLWFQHLAIVVSDMDAAYAHLSRYSDWHPITTGGPQLLPHASGSVKAFKFRDPDGHPLELIWFPPGVGRAKRGGTKTKRTFLGIDHSALSVTATRSSVGFYKNLGFRVSSRSLNHGVAQNRLDGLPEARVRVTGLRASDELGPGLELLAYKPTGRRQTLSATDLATDWITLDAGAGDHTDPILLVDPDGHRIVLLN
jgi:catechol 2,3-dioxygenase-like lactoylglutathione lyase family enzyme